LGTDRFGDPRAERGWIHREARLGRGKDGNAELRERLGGPKSMRNPAVLAAIITTVGSLVVLLVSVYLHHRSVEPVGRILTPQPGEEVGAPYSVRGTLARVPKDRTVWLAVTRGDSWIPLESIASRSQRWEVEIQDHLFPAGERFALVLFTVGKAGRSAISAWSLRSVISRSVPYRHPISPTEIPGLVELDVVSSLLAKERCREPPLSCVFPQLDSDAGGGESFRFQGRGGEVDEAFIDTLDCRRPARSMGIRLTYRMSADGYGGWGVQWAGSPSGSFDASSYTELHLSVRGAAGGETFAVGLKDRSGKEVQLPSKDWLAVSASQWQEVVIPLSAFGGVNRAKVENVNIGFNNTNGSGQVCMDEIRFA
jgi:Complex I intermediate-associated protein 30 (CIA30)